MQISSNFRGNASLAKASAASADITPRNSPELGAGNNTGQSLAVDDPLELNLVAIWFGNSDPLVLASYDLLYVGEPLVEALVSSLPGIPRENIFIGASHTHAAPMTDPSKPRLGKVDPDYLEFAVDQTKNAVAALLEEEGAPVVLRAAAGSANHSVNRRRFKRFRFSPHRNVPKLNVLELAPNPSGPRDETVTVLEITALSGEPLAVIWNYACHPVAYPRPDAVSAHFPGVVRRLLRERSSAGLPVLYFQGFSGNTRPNATARKRGLRQHLKRLLQGPVFQDFSWESYNDWTRSLASAVLGVASEVGPLEVHEVAARRVVRPSGLFVQGQTPQVAFQRFSLGPGLTFIGVSAEMVADYALLLRARQGDGLLFCVGCLDTPFGYAPTQRMLEEGGYESEQFLPHFSLSEISPRIEDNIKEGLSGVLP